MENTKSNQALYGDVSILSSVVEYDYGSNFIVAIQKPNFEKQRGYLADVIRMRKYNMKGGSYISMSLKEADSILRNDPFYRSVFLNKINYWIVYCKDSTRVFGPLSKQQFIEMSTKLDIPNTWLRKYFS